MRTNARTAPDRDSDTSPFRNRQLKTIRLRQIGFYLDQDRERFQSYFFPDTIGSGSHLQRRSPSPQTSSA